jgi:hypothetical protein
VTSGPTGDAEFSANAEIAARLQKLKTNISTDCEWRSDCHLLCGETPDGSNMTLKIERHPEGPAITIFNCALYIRDWIGKERD